MIDIINLRRKPWPFVFVYVGRPFAGLDGHELANPYPIREDTDAARRAVIHRYRDWLLAHPDLEAQLWAVWTDTEGGRFPLACWCVPRLCHAGVIAEELVKRYGEGPLNG